MSRSCSEGVGVLSIVAEPAVFPVADNRTDRRTGVQQEVQKFAEAALAESKREGLLLAIRARWVALAVIAATLPIMNPHWDVLYYIASTGLFALIGWAQLKVGKAGRLPSGTVSDVLRPRPDDVPRRGAKSVGARRVADRNAIPVQHLHLFLRAAGHGDARLFLANRDRDGHLGRGPVGGRRRLGLVSFRWLRRAGRKGACGRRRR